MNDPFKSASRWTTIGLIGFAIAFYFAAPAMRRWMAGMLGAVFILLFTIGTHERDMDAVGQEAIDQATSPNGYYATPLTWVAIAILIFGLLLFPSVARTARQQKSAMRLEKQVAAELRHREAVNTGRLSERPPQEQEVPREAPVYTAAAPDHSHPDRPFYVPTYVGGAQSHHSEVAGSGIVINERRTFDREAE